MPYARPVNGLICVARISRAPLFATAIACSVLYRRPLNVLGDSSFALGVT